MKYTIFFDESKCVDCGACAVACMDQNDSNVTAGDVPFRTTCTVEQGEHFSYRSLSCLHCENAPCIAACPTGCIKKDEATGFVLCDNVNCIGCRQCLDACPFAQPCFNGDGKKMTKCDGCVDRVKHGLKPACVKVCPFGALRLVAE